MKLLHSADLHIGRPLEGRDRSTEQQAVLDEIISIAEREKVDLVLLAGDIYDSFVPSAQAEIMFYRFAERLSDNGRRAVVIIAGNHDQPQRLAAAADLIARQGIYIVGLPGQSFAAQKAQQGVFIHSSGKALHLQLPCGEKACIAPLPYVSESRMQELFVRNLDDEQAHQLDYQQRIEACLAEMAEEFSEDSANIIMAHLFISGGYSSDSERLLSVQVGGSFGVPASVFPATANYVALGHLHRPQIITAPMPCVYAGSPLAYSFSESGQSKSVQIAEIVPGSGQQAELTAIPLTCGKPMLQWQADNYEQALDWCENTANQNYWVNLKIKLEQPLSSDQITALQAAHPGLLAIVPLYNQTERPQTELAQAEQLTIAEQFARYAAQVEGVEPDAELLRTFALLLEEDEEGDSE